MVALPSGSVELDPFTVYVLPEWVSVNAAFGAAFADAPPGPMNTALARQSCAPSASVGGPEGCPLVKGTLFRTPVELLTTYSVFPSLKSPPESLKPALA